MPVPPSRDSRATSSLRIDQQPATTSALVTKWVKPTNINCHQTGLRSLVTNNCGHSRTKSEVSPKITYDGRLHVIAYRATLDVPREVAWFLAKLLAAERQRRGTPRGLAFQSHSNPVSAAYQPLSLPSYLAGRIDRVRE